MDDEYYKKIEAIQFTMNHDDGNAIDDIEKSDIILIGVSRTSKTPTSIYLANKGYKVSNIPIVNKNSIPENIKKNKLKKCIIGLIAEPQRLAEIRKNRMNSLKETGKQKYTNFQKIQDEVNNSKNTFQKIVSGENIALTKNTVMNYILYEDVLKSIQDGYSGTKVLRSNDDITIEEVVNIFDKKLEFGDIHNDCLL